MNNKSFLYSQTNIDQIAFPLGGIGAGMVCLEGVGSLNHVSLWNEMQFDHQPNIFSVIYLAGEHNSAKLLEGPVPKRKYYGPPGTGNGGRETNFGFPRFEKVEFQNYFPFGKISLSDSKFPIRAKIIGWSPFIPSDSFNSSLPVVGIEYLIENLSPKRIECIYSFHAENFLCEDEDVGAVQAINNGFLMQPEDYDKHETSSKQLIVSVEDEHTVSDCAWFRGNWFDTKTILWKKIASGRIPTKRVHDDTPSSGGGSLYVPFSLEPNQTKKVCLKMCWYTSNTNLNYDNLTSQEDEHSTKCCDVDRDSEKNYHKPWYCGQFKDVIDLHHYWESNYSNLRNESNIRLNSLEFLTQNPNFFSNKSLASGWIW